MDRRKAIRNVGLGIASLPILSSQAQRPAISDLAGNVSDDRVKDEKFWKKFRRDFFDVSDEFINLENGYFGVQPIPVHQQYLKNIERVNKYSSQFLRTTYNQEFKDIISKLASFAGTQEDELLITRNATEAMNIIISGLPLKEGDEVILHKQDYYSMIEAFQMLEKQKGIKIKMIRVPLLPENDEEIIQCYEEAVTERTRCVLLTHMIHLTGQIMPVKNIADRLRPRGIDVIVDAAHSFAHVDYKLPDLGVNFVGVNLHKWFGNPLGAGLLYVKKDRIKDLKPLFGDSAKNEGDIRKLGHFGTLAVPIVLTIPTAQEYNEVLTIPFKEKRLRYLQNYWTSRAKEIPKVNVTTPLDPKRSCGIASFNVEGMETKEVIDRLYKDHNIFTVIRYLEDREVVRVTPNLYNHPGELDVLLNGLQEIVKS